VSDEEEYGLGGKLDFLGAFAALPDPRQSLKVLYPLDEVLLLTLCAVVCGADGWVSVALFGKRKLDFLRRFLPFANGTPSHDQLGLIFGALDAAAFQNCFINWAQSLGGAIEGVVAVDGKTLRHSFDRATGRGALHMVSAWSSAQKLVLGARTVADKSNEITAIPELLDLLAINGAIVTIDAMGCQRKIAAKIIDRGADYVLGLKGNQGSLREDVELLFDEQMAAAFRDVAVSKADATDAGHDRIERRQVFASEDIAWLRERHDWPGLRSIIMVASTRETAKGTETERRFYISSLPADAERLAEAIRAHWGVENALHWVLDVQFREDAARNRKDHGPANIALLRKIALNLIRSHPDKASIRRKIKKAGWDDQFLISLIAHMR